MKNNTRNTRSPGAWVLGGVASLLLSMSALGQYTVTQPTAITINDSAVATPYPSSIYLTNANLVGAIERVTVTVNSITHPYAPDIGLLLVGPNGHAIVLMSGSGGNPSGSAALDKATLTFSDDASASLPVASPLVAGSSYKPTDNANLSFAEPAPTTGYASTLTAAFGNSNPNGVWSLYVLDDTPGPASSVTPSIGSWTLNLYTTPVLTLGTNTVYLAENGNAVTVNFTVQDSSPPAAGFTASTGNDATNLVSAAASVTGTTGTLTITPLQNAFGTNALTLSVNDGLSSASGDITVHLAHVNQAPTLAITNSSLATVAGVVSPVVNVTVADVDPNNPPTSLALTVASSDTNIVSPSGVFFSTTDTGALRKFSVVPKGTNSGSATLTFTVTDPGGLSNSASILVNVGPVAHPAFANTKVLGLADAGTTNSSIAVSNVPGMIGNVTVSVDGLKGVAGNNLGLALAAPGGTVTLLNNSGVAGPNTFAQGTFGTSGAASLPGSDSITAVNLQAAGLSSLVGTSPIGVWTLWATNGGAAAQISGGWVLNIHAAPTISSTLTNISMPEETTTNISFTVANLNGAITNVADVTVTSGNTDLIVVANPTFDIATGIGTAQLQAIFKTTGPQYGSTTVTVTAKDNNNFTVSFVYNVTVTFVNHAPQITFIPRQVTRVGDVLGPVLFGVSDTDLPAQTLTVTATSDNQALLPDSNILLQGSGANMTFTCFPLGTASDTANVTIRVSDGITASSTVFSVYAQSQGNPLFGNQKQISIPANAPADTYPSTMGVSNLIGTISKVTITLFDLTHSVPDDFNALLVSPHGVKVLLMGHAGGANSISSTTLVLDDDAATSLPDTAQIVSGTYKPSSYGTAATFPAPAPAGPYATTLSAFNGLDGTNANGLWALYIADSGAGKGVMINGWQLSIQTAVSVQPISNVTLRENDKTLQIPVSVGDDQPGVNISVSATSADPTVVQTAFEPGSGGTRTLDVTPVPYHTGSNILVTVTASAGAQNSSTTFHVTVYPVNLPPVVTAPADITTPAATPSPVATFTAWDPQDSALSVTALSSDTKLIPNANISVSSGTIIGQTNSHNIYQFGVSMQPVGTNIGPATISLTVADAAGQSTPTSFNVTVTPAPVFQNLTGISIPAGYPIASNATPFPSVIAVSGVHGSVTSARVTLLGFSHQFPQDVDVLLVSPDNSKSVILMAHAGGSTSVNNVDLSFDDGSPSLPFGSALSKGTYAPSAYAEGLAFGAGAPTSGYRTNLSSLAGVSPNGDWKLYVMDDSYPLSGSISGWILSLQTGPAFDLTTIGPKTTPENTTAVIQFNVLDDIMDPAALAVTAATTGSVSPTNIQSLIASLQVTNNGGGARTLIATPLPNLPSTITNVDATATIQLTVTDTNNASASTTFPLTVSFANLAPVVNTPTNTIWMVENQPEPANVIYTLSDVDSTLYLSNLVVRSSEPTLIPNDTNHIVVTLSTNRIVPGATGTVTLSVTPAQFAFGTNTITVSITDGASTPVNTTTFNVRFSAQGPIITGLPAQLNSPAGSPTAPIPFTVSSPEGIPASRLTVTASSQNQGIVPDANIVLAGSADARTIQLTPLGTVGGTDTITLKVGDGSNTNSFQFVANFTAPPVTLFGNGQVVSVVGTTNAVNSSVYPISFDVTNLIGGIFDVNLEMRGLSNNAPANFDALLVSPDGIAVMLMSGAGGTAPVSGLDVVFDDSGATLSDTGPLTNGTYHPAYYTKRLLPAPAPQGPYQTRLSAFTASTSVNGTWNLYVNDLTDGDFGKISGGVYLNIVPKPVIQVTSTLPVNIPENGSTTVSFTVSDSTTATTNLTVSASSDNGALLPAAAPHVVIRALSPGTNNNFSATVAPVQYANGAVNLTLIATRADGAAGTAVVPITVAATNFPPVISRLIPTIIPENGSATVEFLVSDIDTALRNLTVQAVSDAQGVVANSNLTFVGYGTNFVNGLPASGVPQVSDLMLTIAPNYLAVGPANISIIVTDTTTNGINTVSSNLVVTVSPVIYPPDLSAIPDQTLTAGSNILVGFTASSKNQGTPTLVVTATSSDQTLVKNANLVVAPASAAGVQNRTLQITAEQNARGSATITLTATDTSNGNVSSQTNFKLTVLPTPIYNFASSAQITIPDVGSATPYPAQLTVSGLNGTISRVTATLNGFGHSYPNDVGVLMVSPTGQKIVLMDRAGGGSAVTNLTLTFDAAAANAIPQGTLLTNGTYKPADYNAATFDYPTPAPAHPYSSDLTTLNGKAPNGVWSLYVVDQSPPDHGAINSGWSLIFSTQPTINGLQNMVINENTTDQPSSGSQPFTIGDDSPSGPSFRFGVSSTNAALIPNNNITFAGAGTNYTMTVAPALNRYGTNLVTVYVTNIDNMVSSSTFLVTVPQVISRPFIAPIADTNVLAGSVAYVPVAYGDIQMAQNQLIVSFQSSDTTLVPLRNISLADNVLQIIPAGAPASAASATITMTVTQPGPAPLNLSTNTSFRLTVVPTPNLFGNTAGIVINDRAPASPYPSTINVSNVYGNIVKATVSVRGLAHTYPSDISMLLVGPQGQKVVLMSRAGSGVGSAITNVNLVFDDAASSAPVQNGVITSGTYKPSDYNGSLQFYSPAPSGAYVTNLSALNGTSPNGTWSLYVQDDLSPDSGVVTGDWLISFVTSAPLISAIGPQTTSENHSLGVDFSVSSALTAANNITVTATGSGQIPAGLVANLTVTGPGTNAATSRHLLIVPGLNLPSAVTNIDGTAIITLTATDGTNSSSLSFPLTVSLVNQAPTLAGLSDVTTAANAPLAIHFTANDVDTTASSLTVNATSSVTSLGNLVLSSSGNAQTLSFTPNGTTGSTLVTVTVSDGQLSATNTFTINVTPPVPPVLGEIADTNTIGNVPLSIALNVSDPYAAITNLTFTGAGTNAALVRSITFAYNGTTEVATINLETNQMGLDYITITVSDGITNASQSFALEVQAPEPPEFGEIADQSTTVNTPATVGLNITSPVVPISALTFTGYSSNPNLVSGVSFSNDGIKVAATVNLVKDQSGTALVTIALNDGFTTVSNSFNLSVTAAVAPTLAIGVQNGQIHISFTGAPGVNYGLLSSTNLKTWADTGVTVTADDSGAASASVPLPVGAGGTFYRAIVK